MCAAAGIGGTFRLLLWQSSCLQASQASRSIRSYVFQDVLKHGLHMMLYWLHVQAEYKQFPQGTAGILGRHRTSTQATIRCRQMLGVIGWLV